MADQAGRYRALFSSDWSECLSPGGPFDCIFFNYPDLQEPLTAVFRQYTSNAITLGDAIRRIQDLLPGPITQEQMDAYLDASFAVYPGAAELIRWCEENRVLFMLNTTGFQGTYQRILAKGLLPPVAALSAHPFLRYPQSPTDPPVFHPLQEIQDKAANSAAVAEAFGIGPGRIIVMGDSGGDGPHFQWGASVGALLIASRPKPSLERYCAERGIPIHHRIGTAEEPEKGHFLELVPRIEAYLGTAND
jgi:phosphoserine phosphatase